MKLELDSTEIERILLEWAAVKFPGEFNSVKMEASYSSLRSATFGHVEPEVGGES